MIKIGKIKGLLCILLSLMLFSTTTNNVNSQEEEKTKVNVLFDFGDGTIKWVDIELSTNLTAIYTTETASNQLDMELDYSWSQYGVFISQIGDKTNQWPGAYWHLWIWNLTENTWTLSDKGADQINLLNNDSIAWSFVIDDEQFISRLPIATPNSKQTSICFRNNLYNTGSVEGIAPSSNNVLWKFNAESFEADSTPVIIDDRVFINSWEGFYCLNENDGIKIWQNIQVKGESSPAFYDGKIYVGSNDGKLYCMDENNGKIIWSMLLQTNPVFTGISSSPKVSENRVYIGTFNENGGNGTFYCLNGDNGTIIWNRSTSSIHISSPAIFNDKIIVGLMGLFDEAGISWNPPFGVLCLDKRNGNLIWDYTTNGAVASSPAIYDNKIFFTTKDGFLYCINENGKELWLKNIGVSISSPAISNDKIFVGSGTFGPNGKFYCFDTKGQKIWDFIPNGGVQSSPVICDNKIYFATNVEDGKIYCLNITNGELIWEYLPEPKQYILASPTIANGKLYICSDNGYLYCFEDSEEILESVSNKETPDINTLFIIGIITMTAILFLKKKKEE